MSAICSTVKLCGAHAGAIDSKYYLTYQGHDRFKTSLTPCRVADLLLIGNERKLHAKGYEYEIRKTQHDGLPIDPPRIYPPAIFVYGAERGTSKNLTFCLPKLETIEIADKKKA